MVFPPISWMASPAYGFILMKPCLLYDSCWVHLRLFLKFRMEDLVVGGCKIVSAAMRTVWYIESILVGVYSVCGPYVSRSELFKMLYPLFFFFAPSKVTAIIAATPSPALVGIKLCVWLSVARKICIWMQDRLGTCVNN